jgi:hypothetical protein
VLAALPNAAYGASWVVVYPMHEAIDDPLHATALAAAIELAGCRYLDVDEAINDTSAVAAIVVAYGTSWLVVCLIDDPLQATALAAA